MTNGSGDVDFRTTLGASIAAGHVITAIATDSSGNTSEFGFAETAAAGAAIMVVDTSSVAALLADKGADGLISLREAITATNNTTNDASGAD